MTRFDVKSINLKLEYEKKYNTFYVRGRDLMVCHRIHTASSDIVFLGQKVYFFTFFRDKVMTQTLKKITTELKITFLDLTVNY